jgi:hypothetical protein
MKANILMFGLLVLGFLTFAYGDSAYSTNAYYAVMLDDRGLASTALRLDYVNNGQGAVDRITLRIPGSDVKVVSVYVKEECEPKERPDGYSYGYYNDDECSYPYYHFVPASVTALGGGSYSIALNKSVQKGGGTSVLVFYRAFGYVGDSLTGKRFDFETPIFDFDVESTRVAIDVDEELHMKEGGSEGNYNQMRSAVLAGGTASGSSNLQSALSNSYSYVSYAYGYVRQKSTLLAGESFTMSGNYSKEWLQLYLPELLATLIVLTGAGWFVQKKAIDAGRKKAAAAAAPEGKAMRNDERNVAAKAASGSGGLADAAVFSFICAVGFALVISLAVSAVIWSKAKIDSPAPLVLAGLLAWVAGAAYIYIRKSAEGQGLVSAMMFVGFGVIITPFMMGLAIWITALLMYHPYYGAYMY